ncbi:MAG: HAMP domain-containing histidine kinase [Pedobacter sp.]|nr:MAG: HAMP domain-containing histidine kinase [Pedobacter sp.]
MKKKLLIIGISIIISIIGIIWFQIDWISKTYSYEYKERNSLVDTALRRAIAEMNSGQQDSIARLIKSPLRILVDTSRLIFSDNGDSLLIQLDHTAGFKSGFYSSERQVYNVERVNVNWPKYGIFSKQMLNDLGYSISRGDKIITDKLDEIMYLYRRNSDSLYYKSDSTKINNYLRKHLLSLGIDNRTELYFFKGQSSQMGTTLAFNSIIKEYKPQGLNSYTGERRWVGVYLPGYDRYILSRMLFGSILSIVLILVMIASFIYLMWTILRQKKLAEMKDDFIDNLTHEFKTPISTIAVAIEGLQNFNALNDKEKTDRYLGISKNELNRLNTMVSNVLNLSSQKNKNIELNIAQIDLTEMIHEVIGLEHFRSSKDVKFSLAIDSEVKQLRVDPVHFKNVLTNLIDNAVKYANDTVEITVTASKKNNHASIQIKDNGIGIPSSALKYVFDKFYRVSNGNIYNVKGIGLGLSYVKSIIIAHKGTINVKSEMNVGTEFSILIPLV